MTLWLHSDLEPERVDNAMIEHDGILLVRKAMIRCGLALNTNGCEEITQLLEHLQDIIQRYPMEFAGSAVE